MSVRTRDALRYAVLLLAIVVISLLHYTTSTHHRYLHEIYQRAYYIPILLAAYWYGPIAGVLAAAFTSLLYAYHIQRDWTVFPLYAFNQYAEIFLFHALALVIGLLSLKDRRRTRKLEQTSGELAEAYRKLQETFEQLRKADRLAALGELSAGIAHEIRNPLGSIKGSVEILAGEIAADNPKREFIDIIQEEVARLNSIVMEFLKFARPPQPSIRPTSVNRLAESALILVRKQAGKAGIGIECNLDPAAPVIEVDPDQIRQVLLNILLNAIQAMPDGGRLGIVTARAGDPPWVVIEVSDTGIGISDEELERVFDPFFTTKAQGSGLGLSISFQLIQNHGGRIVARKNPERGLTFRLELPMQ